MKTLRLCLAFVISALLLLILFDYCEHRRDYRIASDKLTIIGFNYVGDVKAVTKDNSGVGSTR